ncbi:Protein bicaudal C 1-B [Liparis tanakae]|uniref:Protein bicaudal C 1-B n=1 Tax=Liparis tanakae TaxID=230148 RepID=A0A4Z2HYD2_9TELE|nr:Protein bicaudal C 1-B [Liparis tanakae]
MKAEFSLEEAICFQGLQARQPEEDWALFLEPNEPLVKAAELLLSVFIRCFLGATASHSLNSAAPNAVLNSLNSSMNPMQSQSPSTPSPTTSLWPSSLTSTHGFSSQLLLHPAAQATLSSILLSSVQGYTQSTPSPPPGLAPIDKQPNGVPDCTKGPCTLNGHVKVGPHPSSVYGRIASASLAETVLSPAPCDSVQEASGHNPSEPRSSKSSPDDAYGLEEGTYSSALDNIDLQTFLTLTDQDLKELGITTFGARRKMLLAISDKPDDDHAGLRFASSAVRMTTESSWSLVPSTQTDSCGSFIFLITSVAGTSLSGAQLCRGQRVNSNCQVIYTANHWL